jgi:PAS domain S-box-containing protein
MDSAPIATLLAHRFLHDTTEHVVIVLDPSGTVIGWLGAAERVLGYRAEDACGRPLDFIFTPEDRALRQPRYELDVAIASVVSEDDRWHVRQDGIAIWVAGTLNAVRSESGELLGFVKLFRDRTDLRSRFESLDGRLQRASATHDRQLKTMATVGHEMRNPLGVLVSALDMARRLSPGDAGWPGLLDMMERQTGALTRLSDDLMEMTRTQVGKLVLHPEPLDLCEVARQAAAQVRQAFERKQVALELVLPDAALPLLADATRLQQILSNLLDNALKYTPAGGHVLLKATVEAGHALLRVKDDGVGIAPEMLPLIFDLFTQEERARDLSRGGLGIGLALVKELTEAHGGTAEARSAGAGKGSEFSVRLPIAPPPAASPTAA